MWRRLAGRGRRAAGTAVAAVVLLLAAEPSPTPSETDGVLSSVVVTCTGTSDQATQVVRCEVERVPPGVVLRLTARTGEGEDEALWPGTTTAGDDGPTVVETAIPCDVSGTAVASVATETATDSFQHREDVELVGACQPPWELTGEQWVRAGASALVAVTLVLVLSVRRRERRRHRGPHHPGPGRRLSRRGRRRRRPASGRGRRRSRRSRTRRR